MLFPDFSRVVYRKPVLEEVICQLRFPDILRISAEEPAEFQESIRTQYPNYQIQSPKLEKGLIPPEIAELVRQKIEKAIPRNAYDFLSEDSTTKVGLASNFLALATNKYERWEKFREAFELPFQKFCEVYRPSFFTRVGLRYRDVIVRSQLGMQSEPWSELLQPHISGELAVADIASSIREKRTTTVIELDDGAGLLRANHFLAQIVDTKEQVFVVDADIFYEGKVENTHAVEHLNTLNRYGGRFFRWCITDKLFNAMDPEPVE
ncbi:MAG: TIGR04255 family protein [Chromatiaceae bacterium]